MQFCRQLAAQGLLGAHAGVWLHALGAFAQRMPHVVRVFSVPDARRLDAIIRDARVADAVDGVSVAHHVLTAERVIALHERRLLTPAYTVNDLDRMNELVVQGVDAITPDNLAIMELLGGPRLGEAQLDDRTRPPSSLRSLP